MEYIFFDIECANSYAGKAKICSFGYVVTDKFFNIKEREDIIVNPESSFDKLALLRMGTELPYPMESYLKAGNFREVYDKIKKLLTRKDVIIVGHGTQNDAEFILQSCERYRLKAFDYEYLDTFKMATKVLKRDRGLDLSSLYTDLTQDDDKKLVAHKSVDDAEMTMVVAKEICKRENCTLEQLMNKFPQERGFVFSGRVVDDVQNVFHLNAKRGKGRSRALYRYIQCQRPAKEGKFKDVYIAFAEEYPWINPAEKMLMISLINKNGGIYINEKEKADILIKKSIKNKKRIKAQAFATKIYEPTITEKTTDAHIQSSDISGSAKVAKSGEPTNSCIEHAKLSLVPKSTATEAKEHAKQLDSSKTNQKHTGLEMTSNGNQFSKVSEAKRESFGNVKNISIKEFYDLMGCKNKRKLSVKEMQEIVGGFPENREWYFEFNKHFKIKKEHIKQTKKYHESATSHRHEKQDQINKKRHTTDSIKKPNEQKRINLKDTYDDSICSFASVSLKN